MRLIIFSAIVLFSHFSFARIAGCLLKAGEPGSEMRQIAQVPLKIDSSLPRQSIASWNGLSFSLVYHSSGAAGPVDTISIEWTDGASTYKSTEIYTSRSPVFLIVDIDGPIGTVQAYCGSFDMK